MSHRTIENVYFVKLLQLLINNGRKFSIPNRRKLRKLVEEEAKDVKKDIIQKLSNVKHLAVTADGWTSIKQKLSYLGVTIHYFKKFKLHSLSLGVKLLPGSHTAQNIADGLNKFFLDYNIKGKVVSITGDNAANFRTAARILNINFFGCFAHILNLIVSNAIKKTEY